MRIKDLKDTHPHCYEYLKGVFIKGYPTPLKKWYKFTRHIITIQEKEDAWNLHENNNLKGIEEPILTLCELMADSTNWYLTVVPSTWKKGILHHRRTDEIGYFYLDVQYSMREYHFYYTIHNLCETGKESIMVEDFLDRLLPKLEEKGKFDKINKNRAELSESIFKQKKEK